MKQSLTVATLAGLLLLIGCGAVEDPDHGRSLDAKWKVVATSAGDRKISGIKAIREVTRLGLKDAKDLADNVPSVIVSGFSKDQAETVANKLREAGMTVQVQSE